MGKTGRPTNEQRQAGSAKTTNVRVNDDLAEMLSDLVKVIDKTTALILDPLIRPEVERLHKLHQPQIQKVKAATAALEEAMKKAAEEAAEVAASDAQAKPRRKSGA